MTHTILILRWSGDKKKDTYEEWAEPLEVEDHPICPAHYRRIVDGDCPDCLHERITADNYLADLVDHYGTTNFADWPLPPLLLHPSGAYQRPAYIKKKRT